MDKNPVSAILPESSFKGTPLEVVFNQIFYLGLVVAVVLAIFMIVRGGISYMTVDSATAKDSGKKMVQAALGGLVLAFAAVLILGTINPQLVSLNLSLDALKRPGGAEIGPILGRDSGLNFGNITGNVQAPPEGQLYAKISNVNNPDLDRASADGSIYLEGVSYDFRSGGGGNGYLPPGTYTITNGRIRSDIGSMMVSGYGYSFDLSDAYDNRTEKQRTLLRIHPDGGNPGTLGCIGIQGDRTTQEKFYSSLQNAIKANGGKYTITVGG